MLISYTSLRISLPLPNGTLSAWGVAEVSVAPNSSGVCIRRCTVYWPFMYSSSLLLVNLMSTVPFIGAVEWSKVISWKNSGIWNKTRLMISQLALRKFFISTQPTISLELFVSNSTNSSESCPVRVNDKLKNE